jgi:hypothetical protein
MKSGAYGEAELHSAGGQGSAPYAVIRGHSQPFAVIRGHPV